MCSGSSMLSTSWTTWLRLSPTQRLCSNRVGRSMRPIVMTNDGGAEAPPSPIVSEAALSAGRDEFPAEAPAVTGGNSPAGPADQLVASHLRGPTTTVVHVWTTSFLRSAHQTT